MPEQIEKTVKIVTTEEEWGTFIGLLRMRGLNARGYLATCVQEYIQREMESTFREKEKR